MKVGGIILCGGESRRMGQPKATLPFGDEVMLQRVVRLLGSVVNPIVVVAAANQKLPQLPADVRIVHDRDPGRGPLEGLRVGLNAIRNHADAAYATGCDVPLLQTQFVQFLIDSLGDSGVVVPVEGKFYHPLAAIYRTEVISDLEALLQADRLRPVYLYETVATRRISVEQLRAADPHLRTLANLNRPEDYLTALRIAGLKTPPAGFPPCNEDGDS